MFSTCECLFPISYSVTLLVNDDNNNNDNNNNDNNNSNNNNFIDKSNNDLICNTYRLGIFLTKE